MADRNSTQKSMSPPAADNIYSSAKPRLRRSGEGQHEEAHSACKTATTASFWDFDEQMKFAGD